MNRRASGFRPRGMLYRCDTRLVIIFARCSQLRLHIMPYYTPTLYTEGSYLLRGDGSSGLYALDESSPKS
jgi:hypothetical protein